jgi:hypothetical protein
MNPALASAAPAHLPKSSWHLFPASQFHIHTFTINKCGFFLAKFTFILHQPPQTARALPSYARSPWTLQATLATFTNTCCSKLVAMCPATTA